MLFLWTSCFLVNFNACLLYIVFINCIHSNTNSTFIYCCKRFTVFTLPVSYAPKNITISPERGMYQIGDRIICSSDSKQKSEYQWKNLDTGDITQGAILEMLEPFARTKIVHYQCTASNIVEGQLRTDSRNISFAVQIPIWSENIFKCFVVYIYIYIYVYIYIYIYIYIYALMGVFTISNIAYSYTKITDN